MPVVAAPLHLVVSQCLLGAAVRYDGRDKRQPWLLALPAAWVRLTPVCPEMAAGLGAPREPMTLRGEAERPRLLGEATGLDFTGAVTEAAARLLAACADDPPELFLLKSRSPSCGVGTTPRGGVPGGDGLFTEAARRAFPGVPLADETDLLNSESRSRIFEVLLAARRVSGRPADPLPALSAWLATSSAP